MKVSLNWIRKLTEVSLGLNELIDVVGSKLGAIEEVIDLGARYDKAYIVRVSTIMLHPHAERLHVLWIDDGNRCEGVERNEHGLVRVVCGATNVREGMLAVWLPPGTTVPETYGTDDPFVLSSRPLRGVISHGMLASPKELALGDSHAGIMDVEESARPGDLFADVYELNDYIIDLENKMFTHRPDAFGMLGIAREIAGITGRPFTSPDWYVQTEDNPLTQETRPLPFVVSNQLPDLVPRFMTVVMEGVRVRPSAQLFQTYLLRSGIRPINNIVDVTNYMMLLTGQPLHAYDYDKLKQLEASDTGDVTMYVRHPKEGEQLELLNGKTITPHPDAIVIATAHQPIALGGIMGGASTEVDNDTKTIIIECATFDMYAIRRTAMEHGLFTDAVTRFSKGQSMLQNDHVFIKTVEIIRSMTGGLIASSLFDDRHFDGRTASLHYLHQPVQVSVDFINSRLGWKLDSDTISTLLRNVECKVEEVSPGLLKVTAPFWRTDIEIPEDVVEEIGRLHGFDKLPLHLPVRPLTPVGLEPLLQAQQLARTTMAAAGANELLTYSFVHQRLLAAAGQPTNQAYQISNALSPDLQYYRLSLTPSLLDKVHANHKAGHDSFTLFELGKTHQLNAKNTAEPAVPAEADRIAVVFSADKKAARRFHGAAYYQARAYLDRIAAAFDVQPDLTFVPLTAQAYAAATLPPQATPYEPLRAAAIMLGTTVVGEIGEYRPEVRRALKLPDMCAGFELDIMAVQAYAERHPHARYQAESRYPATSQDVSLRVASETPVARIEHALRQALKKQAATDMTQQLQLQDIYQAAATPTVKHVTLRYTVASSSHTLTDSKVQKQLGAAVQAVAAELGAEQV